MFFFERLTDSRLSRTDEVPIISDVKRGSIAHRCGMIQTGDHLLSIDTHSLRGKNLHEIVSLLKTADDVVRLRIKKDDNYSEDNLCENNVVYKVQLLRQGYARRPNRTHERISTLLAGVHWV